jgi:hypothetical protein
MIFFSCFGFVAVVLGNPEDADRFPFLPETLRAVAKKVTGALALCVSQFDATLRPSGAATYQGTYFGASEATIFSKRGSPRSESQSG